MSIFDKLKSLLNIDISKLKELHIGNIGNNNKTITFEYHDHRTFIGINPDTVEESEKEKILKIFRTVIEEKGLVIEEKSKKLLDDFSISDKSKTNQDILKYFKGKIPGQDLEILRAALFIKSEFNSGRPIADLKRDIVIRYGKRGNNIVNLYSAGYFTSIIKPLYDEMSSRKDFSLTVFLARYEVIVTQVTFAVFASKRISSEELRREVMEKINLNKKYGIKKLNVHGIGVENVNKIQDLLTSIKNEILWPPQIDSEKGFITVTIFF